MKRGSHGNSGVFITATLQPALCRGGQGGLPASGGTRHFCAVLFHALMRCEDNLKKFLLQCGVKDADTRDLSDAAIYVEYAYARDLWNELDNCKSPDGATLSQPVIAKSEYSSDEAISMRGAHMTNGTRLSRAEINRIKRDLIQAHFTPPVPLPDDKLDDPAAIMAFNKNFISGRASNKHIQSPSCWSIGQMAKTLYKNKPHDETFRNALHLKWAMRVKPDIVIELNAEEVVCIEAKMESGEALYPSGADRKKLKDALKNGDELKVDERVKYYERTQLEIQDMLMRNVLGFKEVRYVFLTKGGSNQRTGRAEEKVAVKPVSWQKALEGLELGKEARSALQRVWQRMEHLSNRRINI